MRLIEKRERFEAQLSNGIQQEWTKYTNEIHAESTLAEIHAGIESHNEEGIAVIHDDVVLEEELRGIPRSTGTGGTTIELANCNDSEDSDSVLFSEHSSQKSGNNSPHLPVSLSTNSSSTPSVRSTPPPDHPGLYVEDGKDDRN